MRTIAVMNQKGGVGKTTTVFNLGHALALAGLHVGVIDLDPQNQLSLAYGVHDLSGRGIADVLLGDSNLASVKQTARPGLSLIPAGRRINEVESLPGSGSSRGRMLARALDQADDETDIRLIDCPPSGGLLGMNALLAADEVLIPVAAEHMAMTGAQRLMHALRQIEQRLGIRPNTSVLITLYDDHRAMAREVRKTLEDSYRKQVLATHIRRSAALAESPTFGKTIFEYRKRSAGALDYNALAKELLERAGAPA